MAHLADLARMFTESVGEGDAVVVTAVPGFLSFDDAGLVDGLTYSYAIEDDYQLFDGVPIPQARERGRGVWDQGTQTLTRASHIRSTLGDGQKLFLTGYAEIYISALEDDFITLGGGTYQIHTAAGAVAVAARDSLVLINKAVGAPTSVVLPASAGKVGPVMVKDLKGDAHANNITVSVDGGGTIDGQATKVMRSNYECRRFDPIPDGSGYFISI